MAGINGPASFVDPVTKEKIEVAGPNPLDANTFGTWFVVCGEMLDKQPNPVRFDKTKHGFYHQGVIPAAAFLAHMNPKSKKIYVGNKAKFDAVGLTANTSTNHGSAKECQWVSH